MRRRSPLDPKWPVLTVYTCPTFSRSCARGRGDLEDDEWTKAKMRMEAGYIWEDTLSRAFGGAFAPRYNDLLYDEVYMNPDGCVIVPNAPREVHEYKFTKKYKGPDSRIEWLWQVKAYCQAVGACTAVFKVLHYNGIAKNDPGPTYREYTCQFSRLELAENWTMIKNFAKQKGILT